jgi:hypothetical protein
MGFPVTQMNKVIPKNLWITQVIRALTVTTLHSLYLPIVKTPVVGASLFVDNLAGCHPIRLHLPPTAF